MLTPALLWAASEFPALNPEMDSAVLDRLSSAPPELWILIVFGAVLIFLFGRYSRRQGPAVSEGANEQGREELLWRHEKLVLWERQESERLSRQARLQDDLSSISSPTDLRIRSGLYFVAEEAREVRQRVGTDLSRMELVKAQLESLLESEADRPEAMQACIEMADSQVERLTGVRERMRPVSSALIAAEEAFDPGPGNSTAVKEKLVEARGLLGEMSPEWQVLTEETDSRIRETLEAGGEAVFRPLCDILLVDGGMTDSLVRGNEAGLPGRLDDLIALIENPSMEPSAREEAPEPLPSSGFAPPTGDAGKAINGHHGLEMGRPGAGSEPVEAPESGSWILFRSNDATLWGGDVYRGANERARRIDAVPAWAKWISIRRVDTGESVFAPAEASSFSSSGAHGSVGFNGSNELFYGARHLGMYSESCPNEVETRFTYGGWGFGHKVGDLEEPDQAMQASGWAGREIPGDTVFEIALHADLPELSDRDRVLEVAGVSSLTHS